METTRKLVDFEEKRIPEKFSMPSSEPPAKSPDLVFERDRSVPYVIYRARIGRKNGESSKVRVRHAG
jgi:hypothetical protein